MKQALQFIMTHLVSLACGVVAIAAVAVGVLGMSSEKVVTAMKAEISRIRASEIDGLKRKAQNEETIAAVKRQGEMFEAEYARTVEEANRINQRQVLMDGVFPKPAKTATPFEFKELYRKAAERLRQKLDAGTLPTPAEIREEEQNVQDLILLDEEKKAEEEEVAGGGKAPSPGSRTRTPTPLTRRPGPMPGTGEESESSGRMGPGGPGESGSMRGNPFELGNPRETGGRGQTAFSAGAHAGEPKYDATYRARVHKARNILCYCDESTFQVSPLAYEDTAPAPEQMWFAQVGLWIQEDVVKAIAELNKAAAARVTTGDPCVEHVPVKRLLLSRVLGYQRGGTEGMLYFPATQTTQVTAESVGPSFTGRACNDQYDVVRFVVSVVIDQREILQLIDRISRVNFYQCLSAKYEAVNHEAATAEGYFYGTDPVVKATLEFEGYMARDVYKELMPSAVRKLLGIEEAKND